MEHIINRILVTKAGLEALSLRLPIGIILAAASCAITLFGSASCGASWQRFFWLHTALSVHWR
jgi:hypothetical protein